MILNQKLRKKYQQSISYLYITYIYTIKYYHLKTVYNIINRTDKNDNNMIVY